MDDLQDDERYAVAALYTLALHLVQVSGWMSRGETPRSVTFFFLSRHDAALSAPHTTTTSLRPQSTDRVWPARRAGNRVG